MTSDLRFKGAFVDKPGPTGKNVGEKFDVPWTEGMIRQVLQTQDVDDKKGLRLLSCTDFDYLNIDGVRESYAMILDADCAPVGFMKSVMTHLAQYDLAYALYTSYSHMRPDKEEKRDGKKTGKTGPFDCFRLIFPLSRPVSDKFEFFHLYEAMLQTGIIPESDAWDKSAGKIAQGWYEPGCQAEFLDRAHFAVFGGDALDVDLLLEEWVEPEAKRRPSNGTGDGIDRMQMLLDAFADRLEDAGFPLATRNVGEWNRGPCPCHDRPDDSNPALTVTTGEGTLTIKCHNPSCSTEDVLRALNASWTDLYPNVPDGFEKHISAAFQNDRTEPYSKEELDAMDPIEHRWILQTHAGFHLRLPGGDYGPALPKDMAQNRARDDLAPALSAGLELYEFTKQKGLAPKSLERLIHDYGSTPERTKFSYFIDKSQLVGKDFVQRVARPREFKAEYSGEIAEWLRIFSGEHHESILDWLATIVDLKYATCALCIAGTSGAGKSLFVDAIAQLWGKSITTARSTQKFNASLLETPLVVANESLFVSRDLADDPVNALKNLISDRSRDIEPKNREMVRLEGAIRLVMTTNQSNAFKMTRQPTGDDLKALDQRILLLNPPKESRDFLEGLGGQHYLESWVSGGAFCRHVSWLRETRPIVKAVNYESDSHRGRFLVEGKNGMSKLLTLDGKDSSGVLRAILEAFIGKMRDERVVTFRNDEIWVHTSELRHRWSTYSKTESPDDLKTAFDQITMPGTSKLIKVKGQVLRYRQVNMDLLEETAAKLGQESELASMLGLGSVEEGDVT